MFHVLTILSHSPRSDLKKEGRKEKKSFCLERGGREKVGPGHPDAIILIMAKFTFSENSLWPTQSKALFFGLHSYVQDRDPN